MSDIRPFTAIHYHWDQDISSKIAPPYDVISRDKREELIKRDPHNCIRLILGDPSLCTDEELSDPSRYRSAADEMHSWLSTNVLVRDDEPSIYLTEETFSWEGKELKRIGFYATITLEEFGKGSILPHEQTLAGPIEDRQKLMLETETHTSPIYMIFDDVDGGIRSALQSEMAKTPTTTFTNIDSNIDYKLWQVTDKVTLDQLSLKLLPKNFLIADGHHRYTTALNVSKNIGAQEAKNMLIFAAPSPDPGMVLSAIHRIFWTDMTVNELLEKVKPHAIINSIQSSFGTFEATDAALALLEPESNRMHTIEFNDDALETLHQDLRLVPSVQLNDLIAKPILDINLAHKRDQQKVRYIKNVDETESALSEGKGLAFWLRPLTVPQVLEITKAGHVLPQKSTFFYPKVPSGIVFHRFA